jgi:hypothetical protein
MTLKSKLKGAVERMVVPVTVTGLDAKLDQIRAATLGLEERANAESSRAAEVADVVGRVLANQRSILESVDVKQQWALDQLEAQADRVDWLVAGLEGLRSEIGLRNLPDDELDLSLLDDRAAWFLNRATGWRGFASVAGAFVNDPVNVTYERGSVTVTDVNERIVELPFVFREMGKVQVPSHVLDVGSCESTAALSLAVLGYQVTAADPRGYAFAHPNIEVAAAGAESLIASEPFDAVVLLSTIEHVGVAHYGGDSDPDADISLMAHLRTLSRPGTRLILTTPFGPAAQDEVQRIYDPERLARLLDGWDVELVEVVQRRSPTEWIKVGDSIQLPRDDGFSVVMVSAVSS